ncbi:phytanoyl-CoA dioxygenase family protein [Microlunatus sp. GCM10028923]|uniref:phytanoyl-CoA dioxygenase family protein n=1 Tax=Microlunatus sp. GCM10028923 TaxID=3273400 RepID=UPI00361D6AAA
MSTVSVMDDAELAGFHAKGYLVLRGVLDRAEIVVLKAEVERLQATPQLVDPNNIRSAHRKVDGELRLEKLDPVHDVSPVLTDLVQDERILSPLRDIFLDEPKLFKDKLIFKLPNQPGYGMHQDAGFWQGFPYESLISVMVAIDAATAENGGLELFPGQHHRLRTTPGELRNMNAEEIAGVDTTGSELVETQPGDVIIFGSLVPHRSGPNQADVSRTQLYLTYSPAASGDLYQAHYQHYRRYAFGSRLAQDPQLHFR